MKTLALAPEIQAALLTAVEMNIDMLNDMALDTLWFSGTEIRKLAEKSNEDIRTEIQNFHNEAWQQVGQLVALELLRTELKRPE